MSNTVFTKLIRAHGHLFMGDNVCNMSKYIHYMPILYTHCTK